MRLRLCGALSVMVFAGHVHPTVAEPAAHPPQGVKRALLVGINRYKSVPALQGSVNDVQIIREILTTRWGFSPRNIAVLTDEHATRDNMIAALDQLVEETASGDTVYFHYAGHGSQVHDLNGDEKDGLDETIVPQDGRNGDVRDIVDDELDAIFSRLQARNAVIVLDSCHSGTATRSLDIRTRSLPQDTRVELYRIAGARTATRGIVPFERSHFIVMSGAAANEAALDGLIDGRFHGFFSYALARALTSGGSNVSPREVFGGVTRELERIQAIYGRTSMPEPQLEAPPEALDQPLFASSAAPDSGPPPGETSRLAWLNVMPGPREQVTLTNGLLFGAMPGSTWAIYSDTETQFTPGQALAVATVAQLAGSDSVATLTQQRGPVAPHSRAVALLPAPSQMRTAIRFIDVPEDDRNRIEESLRRNIDNLAFVGLGEPTTYLIDMQGQTARLLTADGLHVVSRFTASDERSTAEVARIVSRNAKVAELLSLDNPSSQLVVTAHAIGSHSMATRDIELAEDIRPARFHIRRPQDLRTPQNSLQLSISVNVDAYLTIVDVDSEGSINVGFPNEHQKRGFYPEGAIPANRQVLIPDSLQPLNQAGFHWDYSPPRGVDTILVIACTDLSTANMFRKRITALQESTEQVSRGLKSLNTQEDFAVLRTDLSGLAIRGASPDTDSKANFPLTSVDWATTSITIQVEDPVAEAQ